MATPLNAPGRGGPGPVEAAGVLVAVVALELAVRPLLPRPASPAAGFLWTGAVRLLESALCLGYLRLRGWPLADLGLRGPRATPGVRRGVLYALTFAALVAAVELAARLAAGTSFLGRLSGPPLPARALAAVLVAGVLAGPFFEELLFRGVLYGGLRRRLGPATATAAVTVLFAAAHGVTAGVPWVQAVGGVLFCLAYEATGSLWAPLVLHASGNLALFLLPYALPLGG